MISRKLETMPRLIEIAAPDGAIDAHLFAPSVTVPSDGEADRPLVLLFSDIGGIRPSYMAKAQRIADAGFNVLMPNIYYRSARSPIVPEGRSFRDMLPTLWGYASLLTPDAIARDFAVLMAEIGREPAYGRGKVGAVGYCLTGGFPARLSYLHPERVGAAAGFHSAALAAPDDPRAIIDIIPGVKARVYFGHADRDEFLPSDQIAAVDGALARAGVHFATELYAGALHGFTNSDSLYYDGVADALHIKRLVALFEETIAT